MVKNKMIFWVVFILCLLIFIVCMFVFGFLVLFFSETELKIKKIKFKQFLKFYNINPDNWEHCKTTYNSSSNCIKYTNYSKGYSFKFRFGFIDYLHFLLFKKKKEKKQKEEKEANEELRFIRCVQDDIKRYEEKYLKHLEDKVRRL